ncbi:MAG: lipoxygenase family protein [Microcystaceae cyanobacterium]
MQPYLPQHEPNPSDRRNGLTRNQQEYQFDHNFLAPIPILDSVPKEEYFSAEYTAKRLGSMANLPANMLAAKAQNFLDPLDTLEEYEDLLSLIPKPNLISYYRTDSFFGEQRLSGANAMATRRLDELPESLVIDNSHFQQVLGTDSNLEAALKDGKLYYLDYPLLENMKGGNSESGRKYLPKTKALFYWQNDNSPQGGSLVPVVVQLKSESGNNQLVYTPKDNPLDWFFAKLCLQVVEANHQELGSHFSFTHAVMAPFAVVTARQLGENHPISLLLKPHFRFMLFDNELGRTQFLQAGGPVDRFMAGTLEESLTFVAQTYQTWSIQDFVFPTEIKKRKMDNRELLPHYPFRDDGLLVWQTVEDFVTNYLKLYYKTAEDLSEDYELQNWAQELAAQDGGRVKGMPSKIETLEQLIEVLTVVVFSCGPLHSALNFPQYEYMTYVPNMPYAAYHPVPDTKGMDMATIMKFLPPFKPAADQVFWTMVLTSYHYDELGFYDEEFADPLAQETVVQFQQNLADVERQIEIKNQTRPIPFEYFKPSEIINSINT